MCSREYGQGRLRWPRRRSVRIRRGECDAASCRFLRHTRPVHFVAWNCCERFHRNYVHLRDLDFDVAGVRECGAFHRGLDEAHEVTAVLKLAVDQPDHTKHIGVPARDPWRVEDLPSSRIKPGFCPPEHRSSTSPPPCLGARS
jgi:hypothetical protein